MIKSQKKAVCSMMVAHRGRFFNPSEGWDSAQISHSVCDVSDILDLPVDRRDTVHFQKMIDL